MQVARCKMARVEVFALALACALGLSARASADPANAASQSPPGGSSRGAVASPTVLPSDATLDQLIRDSIAARPELARAKATLRASQERVPQASTLPDPMVQVGIQNDGFKSIEVGRMETSYISLMASQTFPWPGKRDLRGRIAALDIGEA
ncbi:MAG TPA: hypothetical protein VFQ61_11605, partial [Polyangiaceae bacterium]|nr:hypothetical protein [Polyangiaceae bacterium]